MKNINVVLAHNILLKQLRNIDMRSKRPNYKDLMNWLKSIFCYWDSLPEALQSYFRVHRHWLGTLLPHQTSSPPPISRYVS